MCIDLGVETPIVRVLLWAHKNELDIIFLLDILLITHFLSNLVIGRVYQTHIFHESTKPFKS